MIYMSYFQESDWETIFQMRTKGDPETVAPAVEEAIRQVDAHLPIFDVRPLRVTTQLSNSFAVMETTFSSIFAVLALILAATGIYGVVAYRTQLRTHEIGIRVALGASRADVLQPGAAPGPAAHRGWSRAGSGAFAGSHPIPA